jgi:GTP cyclohydrolase II
MAGYKADARSYTPAAQILNDLKVKSIVLLANSEGKADELRKESIVIASTHSLSLV